jgi:hypothetical protein
MVGLLVEELREVIRALPGRMQESVPEPLQLDTGIAGKGALEFGRAGEETGQKCRGE